MSTQVVDAIAKTVVPGPVVGTRITEAYARHVARDAYFWAWPMMNIYNRRLAFKQAPEVGLMNGILPFAPLNLMSMLSDYIQPSERWVACPNQDVVYGGAIAALDETPVVLQVPDFGGDSGSTRSWTCGRTASPISASCTARNRASIYWRDRSGRATSRRASTKCSRRRPAAASSCRASSATTRWRTRRPSRASLQGSTCTRWLSTTGKMKRHDWRKSPTLKSPGGDESEAETRWVFPERFLDQLPMVLADAPPLPGEEARYAEVLAVIAAAKKNPALQKAMIDEAVAADRDLVGPLLQFRNYGIPLANNWTTITNGAAFGTDYFTRTAVAKSNILVNKNNETKYLYQDLDAAGGRLNGANTYVISFAKGQLPPVKGFWSLTMYNEHHFFEPNAINRFSVGTKNKDLRTAADGALTICVQAAQPTDAVQRANWLPAPRSDFSLYIRAYWPEGAIINQQWQPPAVQRVS